MHTRPPAAPARTPDTLVALSAGPESDWKMSPWSSPEPANWGGSPSSFLGPPFSCPRLIGGPTSVGRDLSAHRRHNGGPDDRRWPPNRLSRARPRAISSRAASVSFAVCRRPPIRSAAIPRKIASGTSCLATRDVWPYCPGQEGVVWPHAHTGGGHDVDSHVGGD